ncbi:hypothetical protein [Fulvivirga lutea]|uniref:Lipoprotein n=1 Tax=Fulvivirga lutea TaxID=2810512 RepID=A0A974WGD1_9BACT|nr:hypothetical protein [Fulvivirga lutea]QSE97993.1 hypothetical protein JR347_02620 [Fulvivirga lutea]
MLKKLVLFSSILLSCQSQSNLNESKSESETLEEASLRLIGKKGTCTSNNSETYSLCYIHKTENNVKLVEFFIYDVENSKVIYESKGKNINASWLNNEEVKIQPLIGMPTGDGTKDYKIYNVISKKESTPNSKP